MAMERNVTPDGTRSEFHKFVKSDVENNNNKYWNVGLYDSGDVEIHFGRVGVTETQGVHRSAGSSKVSSMIRSKEKKGYREIQTLESVNTSPGKSINKQSLKQIAKDQIKHSSPETAKLIDWLAEVNRHQITSATGKQITYDTTTGQFKTPMGIITPGSITEARSLLVDIGDYVAKQEFDSSTLKRKVSDYLMLVPTNVGMKLKVETFLPDLAAVQKQGQILDALDASYVDITTVKTDSKDDKTFS